MMKRMVRKFGYLLLLFTLMPLMSGCNNEDDVIEIFTGKTWKLSRLTTKNSSDRFYNGLFESNKAMENSLTALNQENTFTISFEGSEIEGEIVGSTTSGAGIRSTFSGTWKVDGKSHALQMELNVSGSESDPLAKAFIEGLKNVYEYEGDAHSLTLFFKDGQTTKVIGLTPKR